MFPLFSFVKVLGQWPLLDSAREDRKAADSATTIQNTSEVKTISLKDAEGYRFIAMSTLRDSFNRIHSSSGQSKGKNLGQNISFSK